MDLKFVETNPMREGPELCFRETNRTQPRSTSRGEELHFGRTNPMKENPIIPTAGFSMITRAVLALGLLVAGCGLAGAQDIAGIEDCTKAAGLDKRTGCLQSNVNFLQQLVTKNAAEARQRLNAANNEIVALKRVVTSLQASVEELRAAQKAAADKKPESKKPESK